MTEREKFIVDPKLGKSIVYGYTDEYKIISKELVEKNRWSTSIDIIVQRISDGKYFFTSYEEGNTENQEVDAFCDKAEFTEVFKITKTIEVFE